MHATLLMNLELTSYSNLSVQLRLQPLHIQDSWGAFKAQFWRTTAVSKSGLTHQVKRPALLLVDSR